MGIPLRKPKEIDKLREAGHIVALTLNFLQSNVKAKMTLQEVNDLADDFIRSKGAIPSFKGLYNFSGSICTSLNEVCIHGLPSNRVIEEGDILSLDVGTKLDGYYGDAAITMPIGKISPQDEKLIACAKDTLYYAIDKIEVGMRFKMLSHLIETFIKEQGFVPLKGYCGHGIGKKPHEEPQIPNYLDGKPNQGPKIKNGMVFCLEPMICQKDSESKLLEDKWSVLSEDGLNTSHYEHQIAIVNDKVEILTKL